jgi:Arc/MetJ-type ribon-helix-helix transcriptional regulator
MKERISATIEPRTKKMLDSILKSGKYRNLSHIIEDSVKLMWENTNEKQKR